MEFPQELERGVRFGGTWPYPLPTRPGPAVAAWQPAEAPRCGELDTRMAGAMGAGPWARES